MNRLYEKERKQAEGMYNSVDGLLDVALGASFTMATASIFLNIVVYTSWFYLFLIVLIRHLRQRVTYPRIGYAAYSCSKANMQKGLVIAPVLGFGMMAFVLCLLWLSRSLGEGFEKVIGYVPIALGAFLSLIVFTIGKIFILKRFYLYSALILISFALNYIVPAGGIAETSLVTCGAIILLIGLAIFLKFIRSYPKLKEDGPDGE